MALRELDYQQKVLKRLDEYLQVLAHQKASTEAVVAALQLAARQTHNPALLQHAPDFASLTWNELRAAGKLPASRMQVDYSPRTDGTGQTVPNVVFKVPTGGGKTFLAVAALPRIFNQWLGRNTGFVLWVVPNEAIYTQTLRQLRDRQHPFRQMLDVMSGNRVQIMEKDTPLSAADVDSKLCIMLLMLQASNRQNQSTLKMFRDRGDVHGFAPPEGDQQAHARALAATPNLNVYDMADGAYHWPVVKDSLGNALRTIRPVVVLDEGQKATSELAYSTLYGFNPCFVLELTATPKDVAARGGKNPLVARPANVLVEVYGKDLDNAGMIKMPMNVTPLSGTDWRDTLAAALEKLHTLAQQAVSLQSNTGRYIRPILLVQVERTGAEQRDGQHIHALDAKEWLMNVGGLDEAEIAIKTAETNDLKEPENQNLLSPLNRVRAIITKQALQEGWDCPFAYVLCALAASQNMSAMTQLIGRILRQPHAEKTGIAALDESYVFTHHAKSGEVAEAIKKQLEQDGMGDLVQEIRLPDSSGGNSGDGGRNARLIQRRPAFAHTEIYLPMVLHVADDGVRELDYENDILLALDWRGLDVATLVQEIPDNLQVAEQQMQRIVLTDDVEKPVVAELVGAVAESTAFDTVHAVRMISDIMAHPWWAFVLVEEFVNGLRQRGFSDEKLGRSAGILIARLRQWLAKQRNGMAENLFKEKVRRGVIQFRLRTDRHNWKMPLAEVTFEPKGAAQLANDNGVPVEKSLFSPLYVNEFNREESQVAVYLDGEKALQWWHRNAARSHYAIQGWRKERIYPDFVFAVQNSNDARSPLHRLVVLEMKGDHLAGSDDTQYKAEVLQFLSEHYLTHATESVGTLELVDHNQTVVQCELVLMSDWQIRLPGFFQ